MELCRNAGKILDHVVLKWGQNVAGHPFGPDKHPWDLVVATDVAYDPAQFAALLHTLRAYAVGPGKPQVGCRPLLYNHCRMLLTALVHP